ncbi:MAG: hypothetical protein PHN80_15970 [Hespellia sp.]|nr:hypothetical protein [Hespellia sp.]
MNEIIPVAELATLGSAFAQFPTVFRTMQQAVTTAISREGLFRCVFPNGVTGKLFEAKDGMGFWGGIAKDSGGLAQAR